MSNYTNYSNHLFIIEMGGSFLKQFHFLKDESQRYAIRVTRAVVVVAVAVVVVHIDKVRGRISRTCPTVHRIIQNITII